MSERLRELAEAATPGPWRAHDAGEHPLYAGPVVASVTGTYICETATDHEYGGNLGWFDAAYIAAVSPAVVLRLLRIEEAARRLLDVMPERLSNMQLAALRDALQEDSHVGK